MTDKSTVIVIPTYKQYVDLTSAEKKSLRRTVNILSNYEIVFVAPPEVNVDFYYQNNKNLLIFKTEFFAKEYFVGLSGYNKLMLSLEFYDRFRNYDYLLICQLDVFVFADNLAYFINQEYDYLGAPWFEGFDSEIVTADSRIMAIGNGGFSLRKVQSFLTVLRTLQIFRSSLPSLLSLGYCAQNIISVLRVAKHEYDRRTQKFYVAALPWKTQVYEDIYWATVVNGFFRWFKVGKIEDAIAFSFEVNPSVLYKLNNYCLPMATHAWNKYDPDFWKQFID